MLLTLSLRVLDKKAPALRRLAREVNLVWNFCNETSERFARRNHGLQMSAYDMQGLLAGSSDEGLLEIGSAVFQEVAAVHARDRKKAGKARLRWRASRGPRRALGWIPFKARSLVFKGSKASKKKGLQKGLQKGQAANPDSRRGVKALLQFNGILFEVWDTYGLDRFALRAGSLCEDSSGRWFLHVQVEIPDFVGPHPLQDPVGIDLGMRDFATLSDGFKTNKCMFYRDLEPALAEAQRRAEKASTKKARAKAARKAAAIHLKAKNRRIDHHRKLARKIVSEHSHVFVGDVPPKIQTDLGGANAKAVLDNAWGLFRNRLLSCGQKAGKTALKVSERNSTRKCHACGGLHGPQGKRDLSVRSWDCPCGATHDRDVNSAVNILDDGLKSLGLPKPNRGAGMPPPQAATPAGISVL